MRRRQDEARWAAFVAEHAALLEEVRAEVQARGPLGNRDFTGHTRVDSYRGRKDTALALCYLWLTGELMIHHRQGFERLYDLRERVAPPALNYSASDEAAEGFFARKITAFIGLISERGWASGFSDFIQRRVDRTEARQWLDALMQQGVIVPVQVEGSIKRWFILADDLPLLSAIEADKVPDVWQPLATTTKEEMVFLAPLDIVSARGRAAWLFDFEYIWEVYQPAATRRWEYYTLPILYGDRLVARLDPKFDRPTATLTINGFWLEEHAPAADPVFAATLGRGLARLTAFLQAHQLNISLIEPLALRTQVQASIKTLCDVQVIA